MKDPALSESIIFGVGEPYFGECWPVCMTVTALFLLFKPTLASS